jgi:RNA polymerase sigma factor (sigma-70 family)
MATLFDFDDADTGYETSDDVKPHYKAYLDSLRIYEPLTTEEQISLAIDLAYSGPFAIPVRDWARNRLWIDTAKLVLYVFHLMRRAGSLPGVAPDDMDVIQEGNMAAGRALKRWDPSKGALSTFLVPSIRGAMLNYREKEIEFERLLQEAPEVSDFDEVDEESDDGLEFNQTVFLSPERSAFYAQVIERVRKLPSPSRDMLESYFFLDQAVADIADRHNTSEASVYREIAWALDEKFWRGYLILDVQDE